MLLKAVLTGFVSVGLIAVALAAETDYPQPAPVSKTERLDFPSGGLLRIDKSFGELTVEGWDQPTIEVTWIKKLPLDYGAGQRQNTVKALDQVQITTQRRGEEIVIATAVPKPPALERAFRVPGRFDLEYRIKAPRNTRLTIDHRAGDVHIIDVTGDLHITDGHGQITLSLPPDGHYAIDARSKLGAIDSDFEGHQRNKHKFGHAFTADASSAPQKLYLRIGFGDITILQIPRPTAPPPLTIK